jgi:hypothetical protein
MTKETGNVLHDVQETVLILSSCRPGRKNRKGTGYVHLSGVNAQRVHGYLQAAHDTGLVDVEYSVMT